ncbi:MAG: HAD family acid phosphatase [Luteolibacter sp.]
MRLPSLFFALLFAACAPHTQEPRNLSDLKSEVREYADSGAYEKDLATSVSKANWYLTERARKGGDKLTVIFDIDETVISNLPHMKEADWGYQPTQWDEWVATAKGPALSPVRDVYLHAISLGYKVVFLTGRTEADRSATALNLRQQGMGTYEKLILRPRKGTAPYVDAVAFKTGVRKKLTEEGYTIVASFGDQDSDIQGGYLERGFKLPNPFYKIK